MRHCLYALGVLLVLLAGPAVAAPEPPGEAQLLEVLRSGAPAAEKEVACLRLKEVGTRAAVPALAALLSDAALSSWARDALEALPFPEAADALIAALETTTGPARVGVVASLGARRERRALPQLVPLLSDPDPLTAASAAVAAGQIGGPAAVRALKAAKAPARGPIVDALLRCAGGMLAGGDARAASALYREVWQSRREPGHVRAAALHGLVLAAGDDGLRLVADALKGNDPVAQPVAVALAAELPGAAATRAFAALLPAAAPAVRVPLLKAFARRGDAAALPAIVAATRAGDPGFQAAALDALGDLGDASHVSLLAEAAARGAGPAREAARAALVRLGRGDVRGRLVALLPEAPPPVQVALVRALVARRERGAVPALLRIAEAGDDAVAGAALQALGQLGDDANADALVALVLGARSEARREDAEEALVAVGTRSQHPEAVSARALEALPGAGTPARCSLLRAAGEIGGPGVLDALRAALRDGDAEVRDAALRTLAGHAGAEALPDLLALAREAPTPAGRILALRGYWRLVATATDRSPAERLALCRDGMAAAGRAEDQKAGLAVVAGIAHPDALRLADESRADAELRPEAELACVRVAARLLVSHRAEVEPVLRRLAADAQGETVRTEAQAALAALAAHADFVVPWLAAGPYRAAGKTCQELFDVTFPPESAGEAGVAWQPAPAPADPLLFWQVDLADVVRGNHAVAYLKTRVYAPQEMPVLLSIGSDDGVKVWVNGELVHANNAVRGLTPGSDRAPARLRRGWNDLRVKITQSTLGCGLCVRVTAPDGAAIEGLRVDPRGVTETP